MLTILGHYLRTVAHGDVVVLPNVFGHILEFPLHGTFYELAFAKVHDQSSVVELKMMRELRLVTNTGRHMQIFENAFPRFVPFVQRSSAALG